MYYLLLFYYNNYDRNEPQFFLCTYSACLVVPIKVRVNTKYLVTLFRHFHYHILSLYNITFFFTSILIPPKLYPFTFFSTIGKHSYTNHSREKLKQKLTEVLVELTEVFLNLTEVFLNPTEVVLNLTEVFLNLTEVFLNLSEVFLNLTRFS
jgi:hypothetical protein